MTLYSLEDADIWDQIKRDIGVGPGCYELRCSDTQSPDGFIRIGRLLQTNEQGILYFGSSAISVGGRVWQLRAALCAAASRFHYTSRLGHPCGLKYNERAQRLYPLEKLRIVLHPCSTNEEAWILEGILLQRYEDVFGEAPPFNEGRPRARRATGETLFSAHTSVQPIGDTLRSAPAADAPDRLRHVR
jgi:hypothetical protein